MLQVRVGADRTQQVDARDVAPVPVADGQVEVPGLLPLKTASAVFGLFDAHVAERPERVLHGAPHGGEVVDNEDFGPGREHGGVS